MVNPSFRTLLALAAVLGAVGVIIGAFGAHFLKTRLDASQLETIRTGVLYLFIHVVATLLVCALSSNNSFPKTLNLAGLSFLTGVLLFSGSLFIIGTASLTGFPVSMIGILTPIGGLFFIMGWLLLTISALKKQ